MEWGTTVGYLHPSPSMTPSNELSDWRSPELANTQPYSLSFSYAKFHLPPALLLPHPFLPYSPSSSQFSNNLHLIPISPIANIQSFVLGELHANRERKPDILQLLNGRTPQHALRTP